MWRQNVLGLAQERSTPTYGHSLFFISVCADVVPELINTLVGEHVLPRRHLVPAIVHRRVELCTIIGGQPPHGGDLALCPPIVAGADRAIEVLNFLARRRRGPVL